MRPALKNLLLLDSNAVPFDPSTVFDYVFNPNDSAKITLDTGIASWLSSKGSATLAQATGASQPSLQTANNNKKVAVLDGSNDGMALTGVTGASGAHHIIAVMAATFSSGANKYFMDFQTGRLSIGNLNSGYISWVSGSTYNIVPPLWLGSISGVTQANPAVVTTSSAHGLSTGTFLFIDAVAGMTELNGRYYKITVITDTTFSLQTCAGVDVDSSAYTAYTSGGKLAQLAIYEWIFDTDGYVRVFYNGLQMGSATSNETTYTDKALGGTMALGKNYSSAGNYFPCALAYLGIKASGVLTADERCNFINWAANEWDISHHGEYYTYDGNLVPPVGTTVVGVLDGDSIKHQPTGYTAGLTYPGWWRINMGSSGNTITNRANVIPWNGLRMAMPSSVTKRILTTMVGANDANNSVPAATMEGYLQDYYTKATKTGWSYLLTTITPNSNSTKNAIADSYNDWIVSNWESFVPSGSGRVLVDLQTATTHYSTNDNSFMAAYPNDYTADGLHPAQPGATEITEAEQAGLNTL